MNLSKSRFIYFLVGFIFNIFFLEFLFIYFINVRSTAIISGTTLFAIISLMFTLFIAGFIVDHYRNRIVLLLVSGAGILLSSLLLIQISFFEIIALSFSIFFLGVYSVDLLTIVTHESNILNRGRLFGYLFFLAFIVSHILVIITQGQVLLALLIGLIILGGLLIIAIRYSYKETEERLQSDKTFTKILFDHPIFGYFIVFLTLGFILGNAFPSEIEKYYKIAENWMIE
jgi:MFS family permease